MSLKNEGQGAGQIVAGSDMPQVFNEHSRDLLRHCAAIVSKGENDRVSAKGTATFVRLGDRRLVLTAKHVTDKLARDAFLLFPPTTGDVGAIVGEPAPPAEFQWRDCTPVWASDSLDVAILEAPAFVPSSVKWFDLTCCQPRAVNVRKMWRDYNSAETSLPFAICGYPDYGHLRDEETRLEIISAVPLFAYVDEWTELVRGATTAPQIHIEAVAEPRESAELQGLHPIEKAIAGRIKDPAVSNPFGGYSGGPFVVFDPTGVHLLGTIKEGGWLFGAKAQFFAAPLEAALIGAGIEL